MIKTAKTGQMALIPGTIGHQVSHTFYPNGTNVERVNYFLSPKWKYVKFGVPG